ncbi:hypothetical protein ACIOEX_17195 [Streptomyces sp. NPDC087850]|uniref:hypothetical protein n=1 Tax=Streptomyces sp. NPDC087850 TaxID=3365809 RepID=UPI0037FBAF92
MNDDDRTAPAPRTRTPRTRTRRLFGTVLPALLVSGAVVGGAAFIKITSDGADRTVPTTVWAEADDAEPAKDPAGPIGRGRADTELTKKLLPVPPGYQLGPDMGEYGNDGELTGKQTIGRMKEEIGAGHPAAVRREAHREIDRMGIQGLALRTYRLKGGNGQGSLYAEVSLIALKDREAARRWYAVASQPGEGARKGPVIEGRKHSSCSLEPETEMADIESMSCVAYEGDVAVVVVAQGAKPINRFTFVELVKDQLDHIASPGTYI